MTTTTMTETAAILGGMLAALVALVALLGGSSRTTAFELHDDEVLEQLSYGRD